jgi:hypothetical protein
MLIDKETKKRMLEELFNDRVTIDAEDLIAIDQAAEQKGAEVNALEKENDRRYSMIRKRAATLEQLTGPLQSKMRALQSQLADLDEATATAQELHARTASHKSSTAAGQAQLEEAATTQTRAERECDALRKQLKAVHADIAAETQKGAALAAEGDNKAAQFANIRKEAEAAAGDVRTRTEWYAQVTAIVSQLAGIAQVSADGPSAKYTLSSRLDGVDECELIVIFDNATGNLQDAAVRPAGLLAIDDLVDYAVRTNGLSFLVREVQARLDGLDGTVEFEMSYQATSAAGAELPSAPPFGAAAMPPPTPHIPGLARLTEPTPVAPFSMPAPFSRPPFSQAKLTEHPPPAVLAGAAVNAVAPSAVKAAFAATPAATAIPVEPPTPVEGIIENLESRMSMAAQPSGFRVEHIDRRSSRRSFTRFVMQPRSPCAIAAAAGATLDPRVMIATVLEEAPAKTDFAVHDAFGRVRSLVRQDGSVVGPCGQLMAYVEESGEVGDVNLSYVGSVHAPLTNTSIGGIFRRNPDASDAAAPDYEVAIGQLDYGTATIRDAQGSTVAQINRAGEVIGHSGMRCGVLEGFSFHALRTAAQYLMLVDPAFLQQ